MTESIPTRWNDERDAAFFGITDTLASEGFATQIEKVLEDVVAAESWESMAMRSEARAKPHHRELVPMPVAAPRRMARWSA